MHAIGVRACPRLCRIALVCGAPACDSCRRCRCARCVCVCARACARDGCDAPGVMGTAAHRALTHGLIQRRLLSEPSSLRAVLFDPVAHVPTQGGDPFVRAIIGHPLQN